MKRFICDVLFLVVHPKEARSRGHLRGEERPDALARGTSKSEWLIRDAML